MNVEAVLTGVITGVITGGITASVGLLIALKQFKAQRAFDKQLEWYERTIRILGRLSHLWTDMVIPDKNREPRDERVSVRRDILAALTELQQCLFESILYGDQKSYEQLQRLNEKSEDRIAENATEAEDTEPFFSLVREVAVEISKPTRKMLGLNDIKLLNPKN
jgi:hypothetical protein